ncbi:hypothetical protein Tsubulata_031499 [Turnera subulata]|uniref:Uncharacterized protein n=1 Tax=Turnera subulata TaxID=218843 RepID=A0A9Q0F8X3_9ROSI|nr:hypothetical protein Tsubulata_031499 [Turnera subulata]
MAGSPEFPGEAWLTSIKIEQSKKPLSNWSIWRVPNNLRNLDEDAYIPHLISIGSLHHGTKNVNLIAYEQRFQGSAQYITSYFILMDHLIDTPRDVELLVQKRVLESDWGGWEEVSNLFNSICKQVVVQEFYYAGLCEEVNEHYNTEWYRYKADFKRDHFTNPWTIISLIAGSVLLGMTALQTVYTVLG